VLACVDISAEVFATLPASLHYRGEPNEWVRVTRPGQKLHSFLEGPAFDADGNLWCVDVPYGRIFRIDRRASGRSRTRATASPTASRGFRTARSQSPTIGTG
jgi:gluconolactonase